MGDLEVDLRRREARQAGEVVALTTREFDLLAFLANNVGSGPVAPTAARRRVGRGLVRRRAHRRRPRGPAAQEARNRTAPGHRLGRRLPVRLSRAPPPHAGHGRPGGGGAGHRRRGEPDPDPQRGAQSGRSSSWSPRCNSLTSSKIGSQSLRVLRVVRDDPQARGRRRHTDQPPRRRGDPAPRGPDRAGHRRGGACRRGRRRRVARAAPSTRWRRSPCPPQELADCSAGARHVAFEGTFAVLLTRDVGGLGPSWGYFIVAGGAALLVAALVAWQMSRRMARPLVEAMEATGRIASGELASRVPVRRGDYPEFASLAGSINDMAQSLEDSRARERQLLLAVSHDLRTPAHIHPRLRRGDPGRGDRTTAARRPT